MKTKIKRMMAAFAAAAAVLSAMPGAAAFADADAVQGCEQAVILDSLGNIGASDKTKKVEMETVHIDDVKITAGKKTKLTPIITPINSTETDLVWVVKDSSVAKISEYGYLTGVSAGKTTATVYSADNSDVYCTFKITVTGTGSSTKTGVTAKTKTTPSKTSVTTQKTKKTTKKSDAVYMETVQISDVQVESSKKIKLTPVITPVNATEKDLVWVVKNTSVAKISEKGYLTGLSAGTTTATVYSADDSDVYCTFKITVTGTKKTAAPARKVTVTKTETKKTESASDKTKTIEMETVHINDVKVAKGAELKLIPNITPFNATETDLIWVVKNSTIAKISNNGTLTGIKAGKTEATVYSANDSDVYCTFNITVS